MNLETISVFKTYYKISSSMRILNIIGSFYITMLFADSPSIPEIDKHLVHTFLKL